MFFLAINRAKPDARTEAIGEVIPAHIDWIKRSIAGGALVQAGKWGEGGGVLVVRAASQEEARAVIGEDPILKSGLFDVEIAQFAPDVEAPRYAESG